MALQTISTEGIENLAVQTEDLADACVTAIKIAALAVGTAHHQLASITAPLLGANSVGSGAIQSGAVITIKLQDLGVTSDKLGNLSVLTGKLGPLSVTSDKLGAASVVLGKIGPGAVDNQALATDSVAEGNLRVNSVSTTRIPDRAVTGQKVALSTIVNANLSSGELHFAADTTPLSNKKVVFGYELVGVTFHAGPSQDLTSQLSGETPVLSASVVEGVIVDTPKNTCVLRDQDLQPITDVDGYEIFGRLTYSAGNWTLTYKAFIDGAEQADPLVVTYASARALVPKRYNLQTANEDLFRGAAVFSNNTSILADHIAQTTGAHMATAIALADVGGQFTTKNAEAGLVALAGTGWVQGSHDSLRGHEIRATAAHAGTAISFAADSGKTNPLVSIEVNTAIEELHGQVETLQAAPAPIVFGFKYFTAEAGQTVFDVHGAPNAPFIIGDHSLMVFRGGVLQSVDAGHYTEDAGGYTITCSSAVEAGRNVLLLWHKSV